MGHAHLFGYFVQKPKTDTAWMLVRNWYCDPLAGMKVDCVLAFAYRNVASVAKFALKLFVADRLELGGHYNCTNEYCRTISG